MKSFDKRTNYGTLLLDEAEKLDTGIWEIRTSFKNKISRVLFTTFEDYIVLLHGFIKKTQKTPKQDLDLARKRMGEVKGGGKK